MSVDTDGNQSAFSDRILSRAIGEEIQRARKALGLSRPQLSALLPSRIGQRTLLSYEHGIRHPTVLRLVEIGQAVGVDAATMLHRALLRAGDYVVTMTLHVDLHALLADKTRVFRPLAPWARNTLNENPEGVAEVDPPVVANLALFIGCRHRELARHLAQFTPE
jgi:transcriptional regulator with XRE-family HTH domain